MNFSDWLIERIKDFPNAKLAGSSAGLNFRDQGLLKEEADHFLKKAKEEGVEIDEEDFWKAFNS